MIQQCAFLLIGIHPLGYLMYKVAGLFKDCEPVLVVNNVDPNLLHNPSLLQLDVVRRAAQVSKGMCGVGKRVDWQGDLVDGYEVMNLLKQITDATVGVHPDLLAQLPSLPDVFEQESPASIEGPIGGLPDQVDLQAPESSDKVVDNDLPSSEDTKDEPVDDVLSTELPVGEPQGDGSNDAVGDKPRAITVGARSKR